MSMKHQVLSLFPIALLFADASTAADWLANGPDGGNVHEVVAASDKLVIATDDGPYVSVDEGVTWSRLGDLPRGTPIHSIAMDSSDPRKLLAAGPSLYRTDDGGEHWTAAAASTNRVMFHPTSSGDALGVSYYPGTLRVSSDGGMSWGEPSPAFNASAATPDRFAPRSFYAVDHSNSVQHSTDGGITWQRFGKFWFGDDGGVWRDPGVLTLDPVAGGYLLWTSNLPNRAEIRRYVPATDSGESVLVLPEKMASAVIADPRTVGRYWATASTDGLPAGSTLYESIDGAQTWNDAGLVHTTILAADATTTGLVYGVDARGFARSVDAGRTWTSRTRGVPNGIVSAVSLRPDVLHEIVAAGAGFGIALSTDGGATWQDSNSGVTVKVIDALARATSEPLVMYAGGEALFRSGDGGRHWQEVEIGSFPADTPLSFQRIEVDRFDANRLVALVADGHALWSNDGGLNWQRASATFFTSLVRSSSGTQRAYFLSARDFVGSALLYRANEHGAALWQTSNQSLAAVDVYSEDDALLIAFAFDYSSLRWKAMLSTDGGDTWQARGFLTPSFASWATPRIRFDPCDARVIYALAGEGFFRSVDQGATWKVERLNVATPKAGGPWIADLDARCLDGATIVAAATRTAGVHVRKPEPTDRIFAGEFEG
jgi:photosystem II stability/assembly factor-like uncharacterized protein